MELSWSLSWVSRKAAIKWTGVWVWWAQWLSFIEAVFTGSYSNHFLNLPAGSLTQQSFLMLFLVLCWMFSSKGEPFFLAMNAICGPWHVCGQREREKKKKKGLRNTIWEGKERETIGVGRMGKEGLGRRAVLSVLSRIQYNHEMLQGCIKGHLFIQQVFWHLL